MNTTLIVSIALIASSVLFFFIFYGFGMKIISTPMIFPLLLLAIGIGLLIGYQSGNDDDDK